MRELTTGDARQAVFGGGIPACGGGGWRDHGELMGRMAATLNCPVLADVDKLSEDSWVATVTAIDIPTALDWEIRPTGYVDVLRELIELSPHPIATIITGQNGYSATLNGWIQSSALGVKVLGAADDVRVHPTGKLGSLGFTAREGYETIQVVSNGNRACHRHLLSTSIGRVDTCDDVLRDISIHSGGSIASARNLVELSWVGEYAALDVTFLILDPSRVMEEAGAGRFRAGKCVAGAVVDFLGGEIVGKGPPTHEVDPITRGGWDYGTFRIGKHTVSYLSEYVAINDPPGRVAIYPDIIFILRKDNRLPLTVKDAAEGCDAALVRVNTARLPLSSSMVDRIIIGKYEDITDIEFLKYPPERRETPNGGTRAQM